MPPRMEHKQVSLSRRRWRSQDGFAATGAARTAHKRSLEKFSELCRAAVNLRHQTKLSIHRSAWISYAAELRGIERSLQVDVCNISLLVHRIVQPTQNVYRFPDDHQKAVKVVGAPERQHFVVGSNPDLPDNEGNEQRKQPSSPMLRSCRHRASLFAAVARDRSSGCISPTPGRTSTEAALPLEEGAEQEEQIANLKTSRYSSTRNTLEHHVPVVREEATNRGDNILRKAEALARPLSTGQAKEDSAPLNDILMLRRCASVLMHSISSCLTADGKSSTVKATTKDAEWLGRLGKRFSAIDRHIGEGSHGENNLFAAGRHHLLPCGADRRCDADNPFEADDPAGVGRHSCSPRKKGSSTCCIKTSNRPVKAARTRTPLVDGKKGISSGTRKNELQSLRCISAVRSPPRPAPAEYLRSRTTSCVASCAQLVLPSETEKPGGTDCPIPQENHGDESELQSAVQHEEGAQDTIGHKQAMNASEHAGSRLVQTADSHSCASQPLRHGLQRQDDSASVHQTFTEHQNLPVNGQTPRGWTNQVFQYFKDFAVLLQMQHEVLNHTHQKLQLEELDAEREVQRARARLRHLIRDRTSFSAALVRIRGSRTTAGKGLRHSDACACCSTSLSRLSTRRELHLQFQIQTSPEHHISSSGNLTDEEEELFHRLAEAECQYASMSSSAGGEKSISGGSIAIVQLRGRYVSELEKLEIDVEKQLRVYNQQVHDLNIQQQNLLHRACVGRASKVSQEHDTVLDSQSVKGALCSRQERRELGQLTLTSSCVCAKQREVGLVRDDCLLSCLGGLAQVHLKRLTEEDVDQEKTIASPRTTPNHSVRYKSLTRHQDGLAPAAAVPAADADSMPSSKTATPSVLEEVAGKREHESKCGRTVSRTSHEDKNRAIALLRYATKEFRHSKTGRLQQTGVTLLDKLRLIFPQASPDTLQKVLNVDKQLLLLQQRRAATLWCFSRRREEALTATREQLRHLGLRFEEEGRRELESVQLRRRTAILQQRLEEQRRQAEEQQAALHNAAEARAAAQNAREVQRMRREQLRREEEKRLIAEHREARAAAYRQQELEAAALKRKAAERLAQARRHRQLFLRKREEDLWKSRMQAQARQYEAVRQAQVIERLLKLAAKYAVCVPADPNRVHQPTCSSQARERQIREERQEAQELRSQGQRLLQGRSSVCFEVPQGYSVEKLFSDMRLRLSTALHEAGLSHTRAGREALLNVDVHASNLSGVAA